MSKGLDFKVPWAMLKMALLMVLFLTIASGGQEAMQMESECEISGNFDGTG